MEEKVLIKSEVDTKLKNKMRAIVVLCFALAAILLISTFAAYNSPLNFNEYHGKDKRLYEFPSLYLSIVLALFAIVSCIVYIAISKNELTVYENSVKGKTVFGKQVVLPLYQISAYSTRSFLSMIAVATSSGLTKFNLIKNYQEIGDVLSKLINERQQKTQGGVSSEPALKNSNYLSELKTLKELLDAGVITQEEFEQKKTNLLNQ